MKTTVKAGEIFDLFLLFLVMNKTTQTTFKGLSGCVVELYSSGWSDDSSITVRDTSGGDSVVMEGLTTQSLRGGILKYVKDVGYRDESAERRQFLGDLSKTIADVLKRWDESKAKEAEAQAEEAVSWES